MIRGAVVVVAAAVASNQDGPQRARGFAVGSVLAVGAAGFERLLCVDATGLARPISHLPRPCPRN